MQALLSINTFTQRFLNNLPSCLSFFISSWGGGGGGGVESEIRRSLKLLNDSIAITIAAGANIRVPVHP